MNATVPTVLSRERLLVALGLLLVCALAWAYTLRLAVQMHAGMAGAMGAAATQAQVASWSAGELLLVFVMWSVMMVAMMVPSAAPMVLIFHRVSADRSAKGQPAVPTAVFFAGYLAVWTAFSAAATLAQWGLHEGALLSPTMSAASPLLGGALLIGAGAFQLSPLKQACLAKCRSPLSFLLTEWREGARGAVVMGLRHGSYCAGCCWALMALLFVGGVMNLLWVAALAAVVLGEKVLPRGAVLGKAGGLALVAWGAWLLLAAMA